ncbi:MAG TPA: cytochrome c oxidase subunit II [Solirubrobacterales bacterium]|nr:cytochrome c oxidase subunit II [Solirubrobacterales bacterium]
MSPHSPGTDQIDTLLWIGFVAATIVIVAINGALIYAVRRYRGGRGSEPRQVRGGRRTQFRAAAGLTVFAAAILVVSLVYTGKARETPATGPAGLASARSQPLKIETTGQQWLWRYEYPNEAFSYYKLVVPVDTTVELDLVSTDVIHTWDVPQLAGKRDAVPGKTNHVVFRADEVGVYRGQSATFSGQAYGAMRTEVDVVSPQEYEEFVKRQKADIQAAQDRVVGLIENGEVP